MKKILFSLTAIAAVSAVVVGASSAVFTDEYAYEGNTVSAGEVALIGSGSAFPLDAGNMVPGEWTNSYPDNVWTVHNDGNVPVKVDLHLENFEGDCDIFNIEVADSTAHNREVFYKGPISGFTEPVEVSDYVEGHPTDAMHERRLQTRYRVQLDPSADNDDQGKSCEWDAAHLATGVPQQ